MEIGYDVSDAFPVCTQEPGLRLGRIGAFMIFMVLDTACGGNRRCARLKKCAVTLVVAGDILGANSAKAPHH